jgi:hypothetical protein
MHRYDEDDAEADEILQYIYNSKQVKNGTIQVDRIKG